ncbi:MAG TPA: ATP-binding protein [Gemmatimonadaceae bacterium]|nr:ATP-binding protein [Gemmatimonadaceae bacterium]
MEGQEGFDYQKTYEDILPLLLDDHTRHFSTNPELFHDTFFNRGHETHRFRALVEASDRDRTLIITGNAGVGKTSFVYRIAYAPNPEAGTKILPILADYKAAVPQNTEGCLVGFVRNAIEEFAKAGHPIHGLRDNTFEGVSHNIRVIHGHIAAVSQTPSFPRVLVFLDDFDYAEDTWYTLLDYFLPFVQCAYCTVALTMRPRLYAALQTYDERLRFYFGRNVAEIKLHPMPAREVLASRLAPILLERQSQSVLVSIINNFKTHGPLKTIISKLGLKQFEDLQRIDFPFTEKHNDFMQRITNGNLREIMAIAIDSLLYILKNGGSLESREEGGITRKVIGREGTLKLFYDNQESRYKISNINSNRSHSGNSLLYNVLEALKINPEVNERLFGLLKPFGHTEKEVRWAIEHLADRAQRLIELRWILPQSRVRVILRADEYEVTEKGNYYLDLGKWPEYKVRAGAFGRSVIQEARHSIC